MDRVALLVRFFPTRESGPFGNPTATQFRRVGWTNRYLGVIPLGRGGGKHRWELRETSRSAQELGDSADRAKIGGRSVAPLDVQMQFAYNSFAMRGRSYLTMINGFTTLIQYE